MSTQKHRYTLKKSAPQPTNRFYAHKMMMGAHASLPVTVDLRSKCPPVYDQGELGSCTANAGCCAVEFDMIAQKETDTTPSRLFLYYNERVKDGDVGQDNGSSLSTCIECIDSTGVCNESLCPYVISHFTVKPSAEAYTQALTHKGITSFVLKQDLNELKHCLAVFGRPFIFGITLYDSFESDAVAKTGIVPMPNLHKERQLGGHAITCVGYKPGYFIIRNSWGPNWGDHGYFYLPNAYVLDPNLASDFWCLQKIA
jgi:C1A family cysteine protease